MFANTRVSRKSPAWLSVPSALKLLSCRNCVDGYRNCSLFVDNPVSLASRQAPLASPPNCSLANIVHRGGTHSIPELSQPLAGLMDPFARTVPSASAFLD
jgi:hypothetical protein